MLKNRLIASLIIRDGLIVQSFNFKKYLPIGHPRFPIEFVARWDVDEITLVDMATDQYMVKGILTASGTEATPFSAAVS